MTKAKLIEALETFYNGYFRNVNVKKMLDTKIQIDGKISTVGKIARKENFTAEETAAFCVAIQSFDFV